MANINAIKVGSSTHSIEDSTARTQLTTKEDKSNKTTTITSSSTDTEYPTAKATYDHVEEAKTRVEVQSQVLKITNVSSMIDDAIGGSY